MGELIIDATNPLVCSMGDRTVRQRRVLISSNNPELPRSRPVEGERGWKSERVTASGAAALSGAGFRQHAIAVERLQNLGEIGQGGAAFFADHVHLVEDGL